MADIESKRAKMFKRDAVAIFYSIVVNAHQDGQLIKLVERLSKALVMSPVEAEFFRHANNTVNEFKGNLDEPEGCVYALFGYAAAIKYVILTQFWHIVTDGALDWLDALTRREPFDGIPEEDVESYLHYLEKND